MTFTFAASVAWDPNGKQAVKNVSFQAYATSDTGYTTPLPITDPFGAALPGNILNSGPQGVFPQFNQATNSAVVITDPAHTYAWTINCVPTDAATANFVSTGGSATNNALANTYTPKWLANTAYAVNQIITNPTGDLIRCTTAHTATSTYDSTKFQLNATDPNGATAPALTATYAPASGSNSYAARGSLVPEAMSTSMLARAFPLANPGIATVTVSGPGGTNPIPSFQHLAYDNTGFSARYGLSPAIYTSLGTSYHTNAVNGTWTSPPFTVELDFTGTKMALNFAPRVMGAKIWATVDGVPVTREPTILNGTTVSPGSLSYYLLTFNDSRRRRIKFYMHLCDYGGVDIDAAPSQLNSIPMTSEMGGKSWVVLGDSWTFETPATSPPYVWPTIFGRMMNGRVYLCGQGGTGYVNDAGGGQKSPYGSANRLSALQGIYDDVAGAFAFDYALIVGSQNDRGKAGVGAAATTLYQWFATNRPNTKLIVVGPPPLQYPVGADMLAVRDAIKTAANAATNVVAFIDPIAQQWATGTGKQSSRTGDGSNDYILGSDGQHYTKLGAFHWAKRIAEETITALEAAGLAY